MNPLRPLPVAVALLLSFGPLACTSQTNDNFDNPPPGPPSTCATDPAVTACSGGSVAYACSSDRPDHGDTNLVCDDGSPAAAGMTTYCCAPYGQYWSDCTVDTTVAGCTPASFGFRCSGPESPNEADASLACSAGTPSGSDTLYCCNSEVLSPPLCAACAADGAGCGAPSDCCSAQCNADGACGPPSCGANGQKCSTDAACCSGSCLDETCAAAGCEGDTIRYACVASATPADLDPALACGPGAGGIFCCEIAAE
jgi:hypothetical protein